MNYIISDLHFGHERLCENLRGMTSEECSDLIIKNWNNTISKKDKVWILGDVSMEKPGIILDIIPKLHGFKHVILGNHDSPACIKALIDCGCKVESSTTYHNLILTHIPIHPSELGFYSGNIHGHIHMGEHLDNANLGKYYYNVNCELHNYTPIPFEQVEEYFRNLKNE